MNVIRRIYNKRGFGETLLFKVESQHGARFIQLKITKDGYFITRDDGWHHRKKREDALRFLITELAMGHVGKRYRLVTYAGLEDDEIKRVMLALKKGRRMQ